MNLQEPQRYAPLDEFLDMSKRITEAIDALGQATEALRVVSLLTAAAISRQKNIDSQQFVNDVSALIESVYSQDEQIPMPVLDFHAELVRRLSTKG